MPHEPDTEPSDPAASPDEADDEATPRLTRRRAVGAALAGGAVAVAGGATFALLDDDGGETPARTEATSRGAARRGYQRYRTRPDLRPVPIRITKPTDDTGDGLVFLAPKLERKNGARRRSNEPQSGNMIFTTDGELVYFRPAPAGLTPFDFRAQTYRGQPVLTWWEGTTYGGNGPGVGVIMDRHYEEVARVQLDHGLKVDFHEFRISPRDTALVEAYQRRPADLRSVGGPKHGRILDNVVQEVDIATGKVLFNWRVSDHVPLSESHMKLPDEDDDAWDAFHINTVFLQPDGNILISLRHTDALYSIEHGTGRIAWRLGGRDSDFRLGEGVAFSWQHDAQQRPDGTITMFDNHTNTRKSHAASRGLVLSLDTKNRTASLVRELPHPGARVTAATQGNMQDLPGRQEFLGWGGDNDRASQVDRDGRLVFEARINRPKYESYRAYRAPWTGTPTARPTAEARRGRGRTRVWASWNGATEVRHWRVLAGDSPSALRTVREVPRAGFQTSTAFSGRPRFAAVEALDDGGRVLGRSRTVRTT